MLPPTNRPELVPAALVALSVVCVTVLSALSLNVPTFLSLIGTAAAGATFGLAQQNPTLTVAPVTVAAPPLLVPSPLAAPPAPAPAPVAVPVPASVAPAVIAAQGIS